MNLNLFWFVLLSWMICGPIGVYLYYRLYNIPRLVSLYLTVFKSFFFLVIICLLGPLCLCVWDVNRNDKEKLEKNRKIVDGLTGSCLKHKSDK